MRSPAKKAAPILVPNPTPSPRDFQLLLDFGLQIDGDLLFAIEHVHRNLVCKVVFDDVVQDFQALGHRYLFDRVVGQGFQFISSQIINHIGLGATRLNGERFRFFIDDDAMGSETFLPLLIGEIDL